MTANEACKHFVYIAGIYILKEKKKAGKSQYDAPSSCFPGLSEISMT